MSGKAASKKSGKSNAGTAAPWKPSLKVAANANTGLPSSCHA
jgi:hypothetical protein